MARVMARRAPMASCRLKRDAGWKPAARPERKAGAGQAASSRAKKNGAIQVTASMSCVSLTVWPWS